MSSVAFRTRVSTVSNVPILVRGCQSDFLQYDAVLAVNFHRLRNWYDNC